MYRYFIIIFFAFISSSSFAQTNVYVQGNSYFSQNLDLEKIQLGAEAGIAFKKWDLAGVAHRNFIIDRDNTLVNPSKRTFLGLSVARKINLKLFGLRFPFLIGQSNVAFNDIPDTDSWWTISPGAQICIGKFRTQLGVGYQYFYSANVDFDAYNSGRLSAFLRFKLF